MTPSNHDTRRAELRRLLRVQWPLIQAPMAGVQDHALAVAVSLTGALGSLPAAMLPPGVLAQELTALRDALGHGDGARPYNLNFFCHQPPVPDASSEAAWRQALAPWYREFGLDPDAVPAAAGRAPFSAELADVAEPFAPPVVSFHFGLPDAGLVARVKAWGACVIASATTVDEAHWLQQHGADAVIAQGLEAGGHRGHFLDDDLTRQCGTFALLPQVLQVVDVPVIAAGGIADADGVAAAFALGAAGVQIGTAYLLCDEARTTAVHRAALQSDQSRHTALTRVFTGRPARGIVNRLMRDLGPMNPTAPAFPLAGGALAPLRAAAEARGLGDCTPLWAGQNTRGCRAISAGELTRQLLEGLPG